MSPHARRRTLSSALAVAALSAGAVVVPAVGPARAADPVVNPWYGTVTETLTDTAPLSMGGTLSVDYLITITTPQVGPTSITGDVDIHADLGADPGCTTSWDVTSSFSATTEEYFSGREIGPIRVAPNLGPGNGVQAMVWPISAGSLQAFAIESGTGSWTNRVVDPDPVFSCQPGRTFTPTLLFQPNRPTFATTAPSPEALVGTATTDADGAPYTMDPYGIGGVAVLDYYDPTLSLSADLFQTFVETAPHFNPTVSWDLHRNPATPRPTLTSAPKVSGAVKAPSGGNLTCSARYSGLQDPLSGGPDGYLGYMTTYSRDGVPLADGYDNLVRTVRFSEAGRTYRCATAGMNAAGWTGFTTSPAYKVPIASAGPLAVRARPSLTGTARQGRTLKAQVGTWTPAPTQVTYQWQRAGKAIKGAAAAKYKLTKKDVGKKVRVRVTASRLGYTTTSSFSAAKKIKKRR